MIPHIEADTAESLEFEEWLDKVNKQLSIDLKIGRVNETIYLMIIDKEVPNFTAVRYSNTNLSTIKDFIKIWIAISKLPINMREILYKEYVILHQ